MRRSLGLQLQSQWRLRLATVVAGFKPAFSQSLKTEYQAEGGSETHPYDNQLIQNKLYCFASSHADNGCVDRCISQPMPINTTR